MDFPEFTQIESGLQNPNDSGSKEPLDLDDLSAVASKRRITQL
jgi:hypothetical protein